jgi:putative transposase
VGGHKPQGLFQVQTSLTMPKGLVRYQKWGVFYFIPFSCYRRQPLLGSNAAYNVLELELEAVRKRHGLVDSGKGLMPEHVHPSVGEPLKVSLSLALQVLKQRPSRKLKRHGQTHFWKRRYYDFNVHNEQKRAEKLRYMHRNSVMRGVVKKLED